MANKDELISFFEVLSIEGNQQNLTELEQSLVESLSQTFECNIGVARELFGRLLRSVYKELHADHETGAADNK